MRLEFKEQKTTVSDADKKERVDIANKIATEINEAKYPFATIANRYKDQYENIAYLSGTGTREQIPAEVTWTGMENVTTPYTSKVMETQK